MACYLVSYDLDKPPQKPDYHPLVKRIQEWGGRRILYSEWLINTPNSSAQAIRDDLAVHIDSSDGLIVLSLTGEAAWKGSGMKLSSADIKAMLNG